MSEISCLDLRANMAEFTDQAPNAYFVRQFGVSIVEWPTYSIRCEPPIPKHSPIRALYYKYNVNQR